MKSSHEQEYKLWDVGHSQLVVAVVLLELQQAFLNNLNSQYAQFFELSGTTDRVTEMRAKVSGPAEMFVDWFPADFFATKWKLTSLNTGAGRVALRETLRKFVEKKGKYQYARYSTLITGQVER